MDKTVIIFSIGFLFGIFVKTIPDASIDDPITTEKVVIAATELFLIVHNTALIISLFLLGIAYLQKRLTMKHILPLAFTTGFLAGGTTLELIEVLNSIVT
jgi:hypothetical protein